MRMLPPASVPTCTGPNPAAQAAAAPELDPPGLVSVSHGLRVMPCNGQSPGDFQPNSVVVVLPNSTAPPCRKPVTSGASVVTAAVGVVRLPRRVGKPATSIRSLIVTGTPSSGPNGRPAIQRRSLSLACWAARGSSTVNALIRGLWRAVRSVTACSTSTGLRSRRA